MTKMAVLKLRKERKDKGIKRMKKLNYCKTCKYKNKYGDCTSQKLTDSLPENPEMEIDTDDMLIYSLEEGGSFHVGDKFGCVHHEGKEK